MVLNLATTGLKTSGSRSNLVISFFAIREKEGFKRGESFDIANFEVDDADSLWEKVKDKVEVVDKLAPTPWGSYRFVIKDPDGYQVAFVDKQKSTYQVEK